MKTTSNFVSGNHEETIALLAIQLTPGMGYKRTNRLVAGAARHGCALSSLLGHDGADIQQGFAWLDTEAASLLAIRNPLRRKIAEAHIHNALRHDIFPITLLDGAYPETFRRSLGESAPPLVFACGNRDLLNMCSGAVVGTRAPSPRGVTAARKASECIVKRIRVLTSGGALGVDWAAHDAALEAGGATILMLPQGLLTYRLPSRWQRAYDNGSVLLLSESLPDAPWQTHAAVARNALISAHAQVVCVIEPRKQGGSIQTLRHGLRQRKPVFVTPCAALAGDLRAQVAPLSHLVRAVQSLDWEAIREQRSHVVQDELL